MLDGTMPGPLKLAPVTKKIGITGTTPSRMQAPFDDPEWDIWSIGPGGHDVTRWDALFEVHGPSTWPKEFEKYLNYLKATEPPKRVFTLQPIPDWPANVVIDRARLFEKYKRVWFSSSIAYCIVQAYEEGATDIGLWGIDLEAGEEYIAQWIGCRHFIDLFEALGVRFHMPDGCGLLRDPSPYPDRWETHSALLIEKKREWILGQLGPMQAKHSDLETRIRHLEGRIAAITDGETKAALPKLHQDMQALSAELGQTAAMINRLDGSREAFEYMRSRTMIGNPGESA